VRATLRQLLVNSPSRVERDVHSGEPRRQLLTRVMKELPADWEDCRRCWYVPELTGWPPTLPAWPAARA
jgi:hypothetical protein